MAIIKHKDMNWKKYIAALAESPSKLSDIERIELSGYLLRRDMELENRGVVLDDILSMYNYELGDVISAFLIAESPDTTFDLLQSIRNHVADYYSKEIDTLISDAVRALQEQMKPENPNDEYDPNTHTIY